MEVLWFCLVAAMIAAYVVLDGFDLGAGIVHLWVARTDGERRLVLKTIGPVWDANEVWLLAAGGTLYFAFPALYASSFSGFYLPLMMVLWLLMLRGISIEFRNHLESDTWKPLWDVMFASSSALLAVFFGAALGNVVRGVPLNASGEFFVPLWTDFTISRDAGILDWYTILVGLFALATLAQHGALWVALKTEGEVEARARRAAGLTWRAVLALTVAVTAVTFYIQPQVLRNFAAHPWGAVFPAAAAGGLIFARRSFFGSCTYIAGMLASVAFGMFPYVLPSNSDPALGLTVYSAAAHDYGLKVGVAWWLPGMGLAVVYATFVYRRFAGKVTH